MIHVCEPKLDELVKIASELYGKESTAENMAKIKAIDKQIARHKEAKEASKKKE